MAGKQALSGILFLSLFLSLSLSLSLFLFLSFSLCFFSLSLSFIELPLPLAASSFVPYWWGDAGETEKGPTNTCPPLQTDHKTDVLVIGGGYTGSSSFLLFSLSFYPFSDSLQSGMSVAREMKKRHPGMKITVCEAKFSGSGASGRNGLELSF